MAELTGKVIAMLPLASGVSDRTGNSWASQEYVVEEQNVRYPQRVCFKVFGSDKIQQFALQLGEIVTVKLELGAREYKDKWYNEINCWGVERRNVAQPQMQARPLQPLQQQNHTVTEQWQPPLPQPQGYVQQAQYPPQGGGRQQTQYGDDVPF